MKKEKRISAARRAAKTAAALAMGVVMTAGLSCVPARAAGVSAGVSGEQADAAGTGTIRATGVKESGVTVRAYQIVDGYYKDGKLVRYVPMDPVNAPIRDFEHPTADEVAKIADSIESGAFTADAGTVMKPDASGTSFTANVEPGLYMILVTGAKDTVFNPALAAVNITDVNTGAVRGTSTDLGTFFSAGSGTYLKSSASTPDKKITGSRKQKKRALLDDTSKNSAPKGKYGDTVAVGDTLFFRLDTMTIPSFSGDYASPEFIIEDTLDPGFNQAEKIEVTVGGSRLAAGRDTFTLTSGKQKDGRYHFRIEFAETYLRAHAADKTRPEVVVTYESSLNDRASLNFSENHNTATVSYSNDPKNASSYKTTRKDTYTYTFGIDADIDAQAQDNGTVTEEGFELNKVGQVTKKWTTTRSTKTKASTKKSDQALAGAVFALYSTDQTMHGSQDTAGSGSVQTAVSDANGHIRFTGLDEGTYFLKEVKAPAGYTLNDAEYIVRIDAALNENGILTGYGINVRKAKSHAAGALDKDADGNSEEVSTIRYTSTPEVKEDGTVVNTKIEKTGNPVEILDTKLKKLPGTGGSGIALLITAAGIAGVAGAAVSAGTRKKKSGE